MFLGSDRLIVGYDLGDYFCQISCASSGEAETLSQVAGAQVYNIPTVLCKRRGTNQWLWGREALRCAEEEWILVENLFSMALDGETVVVDGEAFDPVALLALFFRRSLGLLPQPGQKLAALTVTCASMDRRTLEVLRGMVESARLKVERIAVQSHEESFYSYMIRQPEELWTGDAVLFDYQRGGIRALRLESNRRTTPIVAYCREKRYGFPEDAVPLPEEEEVRELDPERARELDAAFLGIVKEVCGKGESGSAFLIGDGFAGAWMKESLRFLCRGRRVFQGNNLFSKGACCGMQERLFPSDRGKSYVFLGSDKLKSNIGIRLLRQGEESYCALLDAGANWYEAEQEQELYLQDGNELELTVTPLAEGAGAGRGRLVRVVLEGLPRGTARLSLRLYLREEGCLAVEVKDLGFGCFREPSGLAWKEEIRII